MSEEVSQDAQAWPFNGDGRLLRLASEARRIQLAHLFDPYLAIYTSGIEPFPHQITAVYRELLPRQPLRFLLADDPGAGKTIMAGLLIKELIVRGDLERCLIVAPGSLVDQWQGELYDRFGLPFHVLTRSDTAAGGDNPFEARPFLICRLDMLSRDAELQAQLTDSGIYDLVVCDEAHKLSATVFGREVHRTRRYRLGQSLSAHTRHLLLMTATPHNGKDADFQLFLQLLDPDRFAGPARHGTPSPDIADLMRRLTKEQLVKFDGTPLFPPRYAYTAKYTLSDAEKALYDAVTDYVRTEMNRADALAAGDDGRRRNIGFALQILQRRLASSPAAVHESLKRRSERMKLRLADERRRASDPDAPLLSAGPQPNAADVEEWDDLPGDEYADLEDQVLDRSTAARTIRELEAEIARLDDLEAQARRLRSSGTDTKWQQLSGLLDAPQMYDARGQRRKLIVFTEPKDTLDELVQRIGVRLGAPHAVVTIHGGLSRRARREVIEAFWNDPEVLVLVANDAAGEGVNLHRAHLMVNYDLPWNPNRLEQRFGRIHRIGQTATCHLWNLVSEDTREGAVYARLLEKLDTASAALGGRVYDVLGQAFESESLADLLLNAVAGSARQADALDRVDAAVDTDRLARMLDERALVHETMDPARLARIRADMERAEARRLQPHHIQAFFLEALREAGGQARRREGGRFEITHVPPALRERAPAQARHGRLPRRYERVCFDKSDLVDPGDRGEGPKPVLLAPGHPLFDASVHAVLDRHGDQLRRGAVLVDVTGRHEAVTALFYLEHAVTDGVRNADGTPRTVSRRMTFVEITADGAAYNAGPAPYLDYRPPSAAERASLDGLLDADWLSAGIAQRVEQHARAELVPRHLQEVRDRRLPEIDKVAREVEARLRREIAYWDRQAQDLKEAERAGKSTRLSAQAAQQRADEMEERLRRRNAKLAQERELTAQPPRITGGALVVPESLIADRPTAVPDDPAVDPQTPGTFEGLQEARDTIEAAAMQAVMETERQLGHAPVDVSAQREGFDIQSTDAHTGRLRFIEVKGRSEGADDVIVTQNEMRVGFNKPDDFILAIVFVNDGFAHQPRYIRRPFSRDPGFDENATIFNLKRLLARAEAPA